jgi:hypothetical protein
MKQGARMPDSIRVSRYFMYRLDKNTMLMATNEFSGDTGE